MIKSILWRTGIMAAFSTVVFTSVACVNGWEAAFAAQPPEILNPMNEKAIPLHKDEKKTVQRVAASVTCIWNNGCHAAFTDLIRYNKELYCCFRESDTHVGGKNGTIRVIKKTGAEWESVAELREKDVDLRDPHFSITPDNRLMLIFEGAVYKEIDEKKKCLERNPYVAFSADGTSFFPTQKVDALNEWIWRVSWHKELGYGMSYSVPIDDPKKDWKLTLFTTVDGVHFVPKKEFDFQGHPSESTIRFLADDTMVVLTRYGAKGLVGLAKPPYNDFTWKELPVSLGGPNFIVAPDGKLWASTRQEEKDDLESVVLGELKTDEATARFIPKITLAPPDSETGIGYDTSYPGMVLEEDGTLYISFYWSKEEKSIPAIYLAKIKLEELAACNDKQ